MVACCPLQGNDDGDEPECFEETFPVAAKDHKCTECDEVIATGTKHEMAKGMWDGRWDTYRTCMSCREIRQHFACNGWIYGELWNDLEGNFFPDMKAGGPCMEGLSPEAKTRLFDLRMKWLLGEEGGDAQG